MAALEREILKQENTQAAPLRAVPPHEPQKLRVMDELRTPHPFRAIGWALLILLLLLLLCLYFVPWQQSVTAYGKVIVFAPMDRPQRIEAQIPGRLVRWNIFEGQTVKANEIIAEIEDIDAKFLDQNQVGRLEQQRGFIRDSLTQAKAREQALLGQLADLENSRNVAIPGAEGRAKQAEDVIRQSQQAVEQAQQGVVTEELNLKRIQELFEKGLRSKRDLELQELALVTARTRLETMQAALDVSRRGAQVAGFDKDRVVNDTAAGLNGLRATLASVRETIAKTNSDLQKLDVDIQNVAQRGDQRFIRAPRDGQIARVKKGGVGETVKAGDELAMLVPTTQDQAVELYLSDYDAPLVSPGRQVRLNFAGWPALQFVGWPSIAVGTFAGKVKVMDAVDDGKSRFRIIITPDEAAIKSGKEEKWPSLAQLRPGAEVNGWVMLDTVSLGFELWRQFNAFPPTVPREAISDKKTKGALLEDKKEEK